MSDKSIKVALEIVDKATQKALGDVIGKSDAADKNFRKLEKSGSNAFDEIAVHIGKSIGVFDIFTGNLLANLATKGFDALTAAAGNMFQTFVVEGVQAAREQEVANNTLNIALAQTGIYSRETAQAMQELASQIQATTGIQDDAVLNNAALIQSLGQLDQEGLQRATRAAVDLSAALGIDLATASQLVGKAAAGEVGTFGRYGISIQKAGTDAETFANVLTLIESRFGGTAAAKVNTYSGALSVLQGAFGDLQEEIGFTIVNNNVVIDSMKAVGEILTEASGSVHDQNSAWKQFVAEGLIAGIKFAGMTVAAFDAIVRATDFLYHAMKLGFSGIAQATLLPLAPLAAFSKTIQGIMQTVRDSATDAFEGMGEAFTKDSALEELGVALARVQQSAEASFERMKSGATSSVEPLNSVKTKVSELTEEQKKLNQEMANFVLGLANSSRSAQTEFEMISAALQIQRDQGLINDGAYFEAKRLAQEEFLQSEYERIQQYRQLKDADQAKATQAELQLDRQRVLAQIKNEAELTKFKSDQEKVRAADMRSSLGYISSLQESSVKEFFYIGKAAALATAYIDAQAAVTKALAAAPPPFNFALAAAVGLAAGVNIAKIASAQPPAFEQGGIVPGTSFSGDNVAARVNSGEMILNRSQQSQLFKMANGASGSSDSRIDQAIALLAQAMAQPISIQIDGREIVNVTRSQLAAGRSFA